MSVWICLVFASLLSCAGQLCRNRRPARPNPGGAGTISLSGWGSRCSLGCSMLLWLSVLQSIPVSVAYPMLSLNFVWVTLAAWGSGASGRASPLAWRGLIVVGIVILGSRIDGLNLGVVQRRPGERRAAAAAQRDGRAPAADGVFTFLNHPLHLRAGTFGLAFGLMGYLLSMVCWYFALHQLPLAKAYAAEPELSWYGPPPSGSPAGMSLSTGNRCWACC